MLSCAISLIYWSASPALHTELDVGCACAYFHIAWYPMWMPGPNTALKQCRFRRCIDCLCVHLITCFLFSCLYLSFLFTSIYLFLWAVVSSHRVAPLYVVLIECDSTPLDCITAMMFVSRLTPCVRCGLMCPGRHCRFQCYIDCSCLCFLLLLVTCFYFSLAYFFLFIYFSFRFLLRTSLLRFQAWCCGRRRKLGYNLF